MFSPIRFFAAMSLALGMLGSAGAQAPIASMARDANGGMPGGLAVLRDYKSGRVSSEDRPGNADMRPIAPGAELLVAEITGPAEITHIWTTIATADKDHLNNIVFRIYWDGNEFPSVESPIGDFFGLGLGQYYMFDNPVQAIGTDKGMNCFWPMPFRKSARITATNESQTTVGAYYYYVDYRTLPQWDDKLAYFHTQYNQATPNADGKPYLLMDTQGGRGHYAGCSLSIHTQSGGWWGEGDDIFTIDGETTASIWGTGSEDYFCGAWCYGETFYNNYFGMPLRQKINQDANNLWNVYRLHLESPITFTKSLKVEIEHGDNGVSNRRSPRNNNYYSATYYYVDKPTKLVGPLASREKRIPFFEPVPQPEGVFEAQYMNYKAAAGQSVEAQGVGSFQKDTKVWLNEDHLWVRNAKPGEKLALEFETTAPMSGQAVLVVTKAKDYGFVDVELDGKNLGRIDGYNDTVVPAIIELGTLDLKQGKHRLVFTAQGKKEQSTGTHYGIDYIRIGASPLPTETALPRIPLTGGE